MRVYFESVSSNTHMKTIFKIVVLTFLVIGVFSGCKSDPHVTGYHAPTHLIGQIESADQIVVKSRFAGSQAAPIFASFRMTITGQEVKTIIHSISSLRNPTYDIPSAPSSMLYDWQLHDWQLQFYRGTELLGTADLGDDLIRCDGEEYDESWTLERLYHRIVKKSGEED